MSSTRSASMGGADSDVAAPGAPTAQPVAVLVKVGDGLWSLIKQDLREMDRMSLLKALKHDEAFEVELRDVPLSRCAVTVFATASDEGPSEAEESDTKELKGAKTLGDLAGSMLTVALPYLCIRVAPRAGGEYPRTCRARRQRILPSR